MTFQKLLQQELKTKGVLTIRDVMNISAIEGHYFDTARRHLEPDKTPFAKKILGDKGRIKKWVYVNPPITYNKDKELEQLTLI
jgi:hypothetical protein